MKYRKLGQTGLKVSVIGLGTDQFAGEWGKQFSQSEVDKIIDKAENLGINFIDTAECYGDHLSESLIGNAIKSDRKKWIIATKFGHKFKHCKKINCFKPDEIVQQLDESLKALNTDYIDIYQFHSGNNNEFDQKELWNALQNKVDEGKIKHLGISIVNSSVISNDTYQVDRAKMVNAEIIQVVYNRLNKKAEEKVLPICIKENIGAIARVPLAKGYLTGKYKPGTNFSSLDKRFSGNDEWTYEQLKTVQEIKKNEVPQGVEMSQWALAWCLLHPSISSVIPGVKNLEQVEDNAKAADLQIVSNTHPLNY